MIKKYISKPITIEAVQFRKDNAEQVHKIVSCIIKPSTEDKDFFWIPTISGPAMFTYGDYLIKENDDEGVWYPCKRSVFEKKYQER